MNSAIVHGIGVTVLKFAGIVDFDGVLACQNRTSRPDFPHRLSSGLPPLSGGGGGVGEGKGKIWIGERDQGLAIAANSSMTASHPGEPSRQTAIVHRELCRAIQTISNLTLDFCFSWLFIY